MGSDTAELLAEYARLMNQFGVNSREAFRYIDEHKDNAEFIELARLSRNVKLALQKL